MSPITAYPTWKMVESNACTNLRLRQIARFQVIGCELWHGADSRRLGCHGGNRVKDLGPENRVRFKSLP